MIWIQKKINMKQTVKFIIILILIAIIGVLFFQYKKQSTITTINSTSTTPVVSAEKVYVSKTYGFSFSYPNNYDLMEYNSQSVAIGNKTATGFNRIAEIQLTESEPGTESMFEEFVLDEARGKCMADSPGGGTFCKEIKDLKPFIASSRIGGQEFYVILERVGKDGFVTDTNKAGPFVAFNTSEITAQMSALLIFYPPGNPISAMSTNLVESIARSITFK